uniref:Uncharacterized protein n=1 Tax=Caenorhabditis japonica TaxID=281687 RepID=A0A8R1I8U0_CAEJA
MIKSLLSLVSWNNKDKKKLKGTPGSGSRPTDFSFASDVDASILNDVTLPMGDGYADSSMLSHSRTLGDTSLFDSIGRKNRTVSFDFCLSSSSSEKPKNDVVVRRRSLQPRTPSPNHSDAEYSFSESIFDSPNHRNRLHSMIGDKIYETASSSPPPFTNNNVSKKL